MVAKRRDSGCEQGRCSASWVKDKHWKTQEVVSGGWCAGESGRSRGIGELLMGIPTVGGLHFAEWSGAGFAECTLAHLKWIIPLLRSDQSPFGDLVPTRDARGVTFVKPVLVGEVRYSEWTVDNGLHQTSWCGLRPDKNQVRCCGNAMGNVSGRQRTHWRARWGM